jgi:hypothetical protein
MDCGGFSGAYLVLPMHKIGAQGAGAYLVLPMHKIGAQGEHQPWGGRFYSGERSHETSILHNPCTINYACQAARLCILNALNMHNGR